MKSLNIVKAFALLSALAAWTNAQAGTETFTWDAVATATSYEVHQSVDNGATWTTVATPTSSICTGTPSRCSVSVTMPSVGLVLLRVASKNAVGTNVRYGSGVWHCESCKPPVQAANVGVQ